MQPERDSSVDRDGITQHIRKNVLSVIPTLAIAGLATLGIITRPRIGPWHAPEYIWALLGATSLIAFQLLSWQDALHAVAQGNDVYLFLVGMMLLSEVARREGLFDWLAATAGRVAKGSGVRLFVIVYAIGIVVTAFLSNDATAVVLTPAVYATARAAKAPPLPHLFACAFIANAASFVLPISNPANLVIFGEHMPPLAQWLATFTLPSVAAIAATFALLYLTQRKVLSTPISVAEQADALSVAGCVVGIGLVLTAGVLLAASALGLDLGLPTLAAGAAVTIAALLSAKRNPAFLLRDISWGVLPLVAGLFVLVAGLAHVGIIDQLAALLKSEIARSPALAAFWSGLGVALGSNLVNNLPMGLVAASTNAAAQAPALVTSALLIGVDLGPNLSITGSLATLLWLIAIRREGDDVSALNFLKVGVIVMPPALLLALGLLIIRS